MSGERILRREAGWMGWLSQKLTAKIDRPVAAAVAAAAAAVLLFVGGSNVGKRAKKALPLLRSLARSLRSFLRSFAAAAGEDCSCRILLRQRPDSGGRFR